MLTLMLLTILVPFLGAVIIYFFKNRTLNRSIFFIQGIETGLVIYLIRRFLIYGPYHFVIGGWQQQIGIELGIDRLTVLFMLLTLILWWASIFYMWPQRHSDVKHLFFMLVLEGMFMGFLQSRDLFNMFLFIEVITMISTILITYQKNGTSVKAGIYYLLFNNLGMLIFLLGVILVYIATGTLNMYQLDSLMSSVKGQSIMQLAYVFFVTAMGVKAAFFPVYNWLPTAHAAAPSHISALLSGLLVKSGIYGFMRITDMFGYEMFNTYFLWVGIITSIGGVCFAMVQKDIKLILGYHTISQVGLIFTALSVPDYLAQEAGLIHLLNHGIFKGLLFIGAGITARIYGTRSVDKIRGVLKKAPIISIGLIIGSLAITGFPLFNGYAGKHLIMESFKEQHLVYWVLTFVNLGTMISFIKLSAIHFGESTMRSSPVVSKFIKISVLVLSLLCITSFPFLRVSSINQWTLSSLAYIPHTIMVDIIKYFLMMEIGYGVYIGIIRKDPKLIKAMRSFNLSFENSNLMLMFFIFTMIVFGTQLIL